VPSIDLLKRYVPCAHRKDCNHNHPDAQSAGQCDCCADDRDDGKTIYWVRAFDLTWVVPSVIFALLRRGRSDTILTKVRGTSFASLASPTARQPARHVRLQDIATGAR
jgi:hypothetical protein